MPIIPQSILNLAVQLRQNGFQSYLVGGCVRDLAIGRLPKDWDIATNARPEQIQKIFPDSVYENKFGTVAVKIRNYGSETVIVEITTFRLEGKYTDKRHPDEIKFAQTIEEDLNRRDFTMNAMAMEISNFNPLSGGKILDIIDPFGGQQDIKNKIIRAAGNPSERFSEDALRLMRAVRFASQLGIFRGWQIEKQTFQAVKKQAGLIEAIAKERVRDELIKIIMSENATEGIELLEETGLLKYVIPELRDGIKVGQNKHHIYSVWEHNLLALDYAAKKDYSLEIRLASLLHDVGKPQTKGGEGPNCTFYNHEVVGAKISARILDRLNFSKETTEKIVHLVRYHLFYYNVGEVTEAGVRRFLARVGPENVDDLIKVREADRIGSGVPKAIPYKLRHLLFMIEKVRRDPISPKMLKINGSDVMEILRIQPGPRIGHILAILLDEVLDNPQNNTKENLLLRTKSLGELSDKELEKLSRQAKGKKDEFESGVEEKIKDKYYVK